MQGNLQLRLSKQGTLKNRCLLHVAMFDTTQTLQNTLGDSKISIMSVSCRIVFLGQHKLRLTIILNKYDTF